MAASSSDTVLTSSRGSAASTTRPSAQPTGARRANHACLSALCWNYVVTLPDFYNP